MSKAKSKASTCPKNGAVECIYHGGCDWCGWNPAVKEKRLRLIRQKREELNKARAAEKKEKNLNPWWFRGTKRRRSGGDKRG